MTFRLRVALGVAATVAGFAVTLTLLNTFRPTPFDPLRFSPQVVTDHETPRESASLHVGHPAHVDAVKCSLAKTTTTGEVLWVEISPPGLVVKQQSTTGFYPGRNGIIPGPANDPAHEQKADELGCLERHFTNPMPQGVQDEVRAEVRHGYAATVWRLVGMETPRHAHAVTEQWETNTLVLVP